MPRGHMRRNPHPASRIERSWQHPMLRLIPTKQKKNWGNRSTGGDTTNTSFLRTLSSFVRAHRRGRALSRRARPAHAQSPGKGAIQDQELLPRGYERSRWTLIVSYQSRGFCTLGGDIWGSRSTYR